MRGWVALVMSASGGNASTYARLECMAQLWALGGVAVLATVAKSGSGFIREVKRLPGVETIELTRESAGKVEEDLVILLKTAFATSPP